MVMPSRPRLTLVIPVFNEAAIARDYLSQLSHLSDQETIEILVVDGGSRDNTVEICHQFPVKVLVSPIAGRAAQMNFGARQAQGEILCFLHLDCRLPPDFFHHIETILNRPQVVAGAFALAIDLPSWPYRWLEKGVNWRSRLCQLPYGDQGLFLTAKQFWQLGGFAKLPLMEDYEFVQRLKTHGQVAIAPVPIITSGRRWQQLGLVKTTFINQGIILGYHLGIDPHTLARWYRRRASSH